MPSNAKRVDDITGDLSPEDKARLLIEDMVRPEPAVSESDRRKLLKGMRGQEGQRYNSFLDRYRLLFHNLLALLVMALDLEKDLYARDRMLWYHKALVEVEESISLDVFDTGVSRALLVDNPNLKPGKPLKIRVPFAEVVLGVWGRKRTPVNSKGGVYLDNRVSASLDIYAKQIRDKAVTLKALYRWVQEESRSMELTGPETTAAEAVQDIASHDLTMSKIERDYEDRHRQWDEEGLTCEERLQRIIDEEPSLLCASVFPVEDRWALEWDELEEDTQLAERIRQDPVGWLT